MQHEGTVFRVTITRAHGGLPEGASALVMPEGIRVTADSGLAHDLSFSAMSVECSGLESEFVTCRDATLAVSSDVPAFLEALRTQGGAAMTEKLAGLAALRAQHRKRGHAGIAIAIGLVLVIGALFFAAPRIFAATVMWMPTSIDRTLGDAADGEIASFGPRYNDAETNAFVRTIVTRLAAHAGRPTFEYRVTVVQSDQINAFALPGGRVVVLTGLLAFIEKPDELAGVLGHEIAHVTGRHGLRNVAHKLGTGFLLSLVFGDASDMVQTGGAVAAMAMDNGYSRDQESEADEEGLRIANAAGFDGMALASFFERMKARASSLEQAMAWVGDHPDDDARIRAIRSHGPRATPRPRDALDDQLASIRAKIGTPP